MSKEDKTRGTGSNGEKPSGKPKRTRKTLVRKTRYMALEPRIVFDGALAADIADKTVQDAGAASKPVADALAEKTLPAVDWNQTSVPPATVADGRSAPASAVADKAAADKAIEAANKAIDERAVQMAPEFSSGRTEVVFVDVTVRDFQTLLRDISPSTRVVMLDSGRDAVAQIADVMSQYQPGKVDAIHLITHGNEGQIDFGSGVLNSTTMRSTYADALAKIGESLTEDADILVYGCDFGKGEIGRDAAATLARFTGADVAASTNATGDAALGGDWNLELHEGKIETDMIVGRLGQDGWHDLLAIHTLDFDTSGAWNTATGPLVGNYTAAGGYTDYMVDGNPVRIRVDTPVYGTPKLANDYTGGISPAQNSLQFVVGDPTKSFQQNGAQSTVTIDFSGQPGGAVSNVGFALYDVDNAESAIFTATRFDGTTTTNIAPTNIATSSSNYVSAASATSATVSGNGTDSTSTTPYGNTYVYFNTNGIKSVSFTYVGYNDWTLVVMNDLTFFGANVSPPVLDLDSSSATTVTAGDDFASQTYANSTAGGTLPWASDWVESDATGGGSSTAGQVRVADTPTAGTDYGLRLNNSGTAGQFTGASRAIDLSAVSNSLLEFDYVTAGSLNSADAVVLEVSTNGGTNWTTLKTYTGSSASGTAYTHDAVSIAGYESADTVIRFRVSGTAAYTGSSEFFYVDNVKVTSLPTGSTNTYTEGDTTGVLIAAASNATVTDSDSSDMASARVSIENVLSGDVLTFSTSGISVPGAITGNYDAVTGVLTLTGTASKADYQMVVNSIRYKNTGDDPTAGGTRATVVVAAAVTDSGFNEGNKATSLISINAQNDAPVNTLASSYTTTEDTSVALGGLSIADADGGTGIMSVTLSVDSGTLTAASGGSVTVTGSGSNSIVLTGTLANINARLASTAPVFNPLADAFGAVTLTMLTSDGGNTGSGGAQSDLDTRTITVLPVSDAPVGVGKTITVKDNSRIYLTASDFGFSDVDGDQFLQVNFVTTAQGGTDGLYLNGVRQTAPFTATVAQINANQLYWQANTSSRTFTFRVQDDSASSNTDTVSRTLQFTHDGTNSAPVLTAGSGALTAITENDTGGSGQLISSFASGYISDSDTGTPAKGIAITGLSIGSGPGTGSWQYSLDLGASWTTIVAPAANKALVLPDSARIRFLPDGVNGITVDPTITYRAWDRTDGSVPGSVVTPGAGGGTSAYSTGSRTATIAVSPVNDAPTLSLTATNPTFTEGAGSTQAGAVSVFSGASINTIETGQAVRSLSFTVAGLADGANERIVVDGTTITLGADGSGTTAANAMGYTVTLSGSTATVTLTKVAGVSAANVQTLINAITYQDTSVNDPTPGNRIFTLTSIQDTGGGPDTTPLSIASTVNVVAVNDAPTLGAIPAAFTVLEDVAGNLVYTGTPFVDVDSGTLTVTLSIADGTVDATTSGGVTVGGTGTARTFSGTTAALNAYFTTAGKITYTTAPDSNAVRTLTTQVSDASLSASSTSTVNITPVNDAPVRTAGTVAPLVINEDAPIASLGLGTVNYDPGGGAAESGQTLTYTVTALPAGTLGTVYLGDGLTVVTVNTSYTLAQIQGMKFSAAPDAFGSGTFAYTVRDSGGGSGLNVDTLSESLLITVNPVNDAPENATASNYNTPKDTPLTFSTLQGNPISVEDIDSPTLTVTLTATNGRLTLSGTSGLSFGSGDGTSDTTMTFTGTQADVNAALDGMFFDPSGGYIGSASVTIDTSDGVAPPVSDTIAIAVTTQPPRLDLADGSANLSVSDGFGSGGYAGASGGAIPWTGDWVENDADGNPQDAGQGDVQIANISGSNRIVLGDPSGSGGNSANRASIQRAVDLSGYVNATLSFDLSTSGNVDNNDRYVVEASTDGGVTFSILKSYRNDVNSAETVSLSGYESANTVVRFRLTSNFSGNEYVYVDNVSITAQPTDYTTDYTENGSGVSISALPKITDADSTTLAGATITLTNAKPGDMLSAGSLPAGISASVAGNVVTLSTVSGAPTLAEYQAAINAIQFSNSSEKPDVADRTVTVVLEGDYGALSNVATTTIRVHAVNDAPVATAGGALAYTEQGAAAVIDNTITISDVDDANMAGATVTIASPVAGDTLNFVDQNGITGSYAGGVLTLSGTATKAQYETALRSVTFSNTSSDDPTAGNTRMSRTVTWTVTDANSDGAGAKTSTGVTSTINVTPVPEAPTISSVPENSGGGINAAEASDGTPVVVALPFDAVTGDTLTVSWGGQSVNHTLTASDISTGTATVSVSAAKIAAQGDGTFNVSATVTNPFGQTGAASTVSSVTVDVTAPAPTIAVNAITADNIVNAAEAGGTVTVTGTVSGEFNAGDTVSLAVNGTSYTGTVNALGGFAKIVHATELQSPTTVDASVSTTDTAGNVGSGATTHTHTVDVTAPAPTIAVSPPIAIAPPVPPTTSTIGASVTFPGESTPSLGAPAVPGASQGIPAFDQPSNIAGSLSGQSGTSPKPVSEDSSIASVVDALPPTAAGTPPPPLPEEGFAVERISQSVLGDRGAELVSMTGSRLFVLEGVTDVQADKQFQVPANAFAHTDESALIRLEARQSNGDPLPAWMQFNQISGTFTGTPPDGRPVALEVQVLAHDNQAREASVIFKLELGVTGAGAGTAQAGTAFESSDRGFSVARIGMGSERAGGSTRDNAALPVGDRLFVLEGVTSAVGEHKYQVPQSAFAHTDANAVVRLEARQSNGEPLPAWLQFDPVSGLFRGTPPSGQPVTMDVIVVARDAQAHEASIAFKLELGVVGADAPAAGSQRGGPVEALPARAGGTGIDQGTGHGGVPGAGASLDTGRGVESQRFFASSDGMAGQTALAESSAAAGLGFPVARIPAGDMLRVAGGEPLAVGEHRLFVYQGIFTARGDDLYQVPLDAFGHSDPSAIVRLEAHRADGSPLPLWLRFDSLTGTFSGTPPDGQRAFLEIVLTARDEEGREATLEFTLELGVKISDEAPVKAATDPAAPQPRARADAGEGEIDPQAIVADGKDPGEAAKDPLEKGKPVKTGAAPFNEQIKTAKMARDPLIAKILGRTGGNGAPPGRL